MAQKQKTISFEKLVKSYKLDIPIQDKPLFFNHISKTGGTSFTGILFSIAVCHNKIFQHIPKKYGDKAEELPDTLKQMKPMVFTGESKYGFHTEFDADKSFNLLTVVRDPVDRVVSHYFWLKKKDKQHSTPISDADFLRFLEQKAETKRELCTQYIYGYASIKGKPIDEVLEVCKQHLAHYFAFCSTENIDKMASFILSHYRSASVVFNDAKKELDPRKDELKAKFRDHILALNPLDHALYSYVKQQEPQFFLQTKGLEVNQEGIAIINKFGKEFDFIKLNINPKS